MGIIVPCKCGKRYEAREALLGKRFPCSKCGTTLEIRHPAPILPPSTRPKTVGRGWLPACPSQAAVAEAVS